MDLSAGNEVVTLGECLASLVATTPGPLAETTSFERHVAGAEANVAVGLARLGHSVAYVGRVGADGFGTAIARRLRGEGVATTHLAIDADARTGLMVRERRTVGASEVMYHRSGSAGSRLAADDVDRAVDAGVFEGARWLHLTGITPALSDTARGATFRARDLARQAGLIVSLDVNLRRRLWSDEVAGATLRDLAAPVDVVLGSPDELAVIADLDADHGPAALAAGVTALGPATVVATLGPAGALGLESGATPLHAPAIAIPLVADPVGAGDAFCAGFIAGRLEGVDLETAMRMGNACGALAVAVVGDQAGLPDRAELDRLLAGGGGDTLR